MSETTNESSDTDETSVHTSESSETDEPGEPEPAAAIPEGKKKRRKKKTDSDKEQSSEDSFDPAYDSDEIITHAEDNEQRERWRIKRRALKRERIRRRRAKRDQKLMRILGRALTQAAHAGRPPVLWRETKSAYQDWVRDYDTFTKRGGDIPMGKLITAELLAVLSIGFDGQLATASNEEVKRHIGGQYAPVNKDQALKMLKNIVYETNENKQLTVSAVQHHCLQWHRILETCDATYKQGDDNNRPRTKHLVRAFVKSLEPEILRARVQGEEHKTLEAAQKSAIAEVRKLQHMSQELGLEETGEKKQKAKPKPAGQPAEPSPREAAGGGAGVNNRTGQDRGHGGGRGRSRGRGGSQRPSTRSPPRDRDHKEKKSCTKCGFNNHTADECRHSPTKARELLIKAKKQKMGDGKYRKTGKMSAAAAKDEVNELDLPSRADMPVKRVVFRLPGSSSKQQLAVDAFFDSGAPCNFLSRAIAERAEKLGAVRRRVSGVPALQAGKSKVNTEDYTLEFPVQWGRKPDDDSPILAKTVEQRMKFLVSDDWGEDAIIGFPDLQSSGLLLDALQDKHAKLPRAVKADHEAIVKKIDAKISDDDDEERYRAEMADLMDGLDDGERSLTLSYHEREDSNDRHDRA